MPLNLLFGGRLGGGIVIGERSRCEHVMDQICQSLNRERLLEKRDVIGDNVVRFPLMVRQARH